MVGSVYGDTNKPDKSKYGQPESMYKTAPSRGCMRDVLNVDVFVKDGEDTHGTVTYLWERLVHTSYTESRLYLAMNSQFPTS